MYTITLDSSSDTSPSPPILSSNSESQTTTTSHTRNVTPVTPSEKTRSLITNTSSVSSSPVTSRPPITEIPITFRSQISPNNFPLVHIPNPEPVERYVNYKQPTAIKTVRLQPQLNLVHIPDTEYTQLPPLQLPSEISTTSSKLYPPLKPLRKPSTSLSNLLDNTSEYIPSLQDNTSEYKTLQVHFLSHIIDIILETSPHVDTVQILQHLIFPLSQAILLYDLQANTLNLSPLKHSLRSLTHNRILHLA